MANPTKVDVLSILTKLGACDKRFAFVGLTPEQALAAATSSDLEWLCDKVLTSAERVALDEARTTAWRAYEEARAPAWRAYDEATAAAWRAYQEARTAARRVYEEATAAAQRAALLGSAWWAREIESQRCLAHAMAVATCIGAAQ